MPAPGKVETAQQKDHPHEKCGKGVAGLTVDLIPHKNTDPVDQSPAEPLFKTAHDAQDHGADAQDRGRTVKPGGTGVESPERKGSCAPDDAEAKKEKSSFAP